MAKLKIAPLYIRGDDGTLKKIDALGGSATGQGYTKDEADELFSTKSSLSQKVGYVERVDSTLNLYADSTKAKLIGSVSLPSSGGGSGSDWTESQIKTLIESYGYITSSALTGYLKSSDLSDWAKSSTKPSYTALEVGALPSTTIIPTVPTSEISANTSARHNHDNKSVLDAITSEKVEEWNGKSTFDGNYNSLTNKPNLFDGDYNSLTNKPSIPTVSNDFTNDYKSHVDTMWADWQSMETSLSALEGVI